MGKGSVKMVGAGQKVPRRRDPKVFHVESNGRFATERFQNDEVFGVVNDPGVGVPKNLLAFEHIGTHDLWVKRVK